MCARVHVPVCARVRERLRLHPEAGVRQAAVAEASVWGPGSRTGGAQTAHSASAGPRVAGPAGTDYTARLEGLQSGSGGHWRFH